MPKYRDGFVPKKNCKICRTIIDTETGDELYKRIALSKAFTRDGEPLTAIWRDFPSSFSYLALQNHTKKHQAPTDAMLKSNRLGKFAEDQQLKELKEAVNTLKARDDIIRKILEKADDPEFLEKANIRDLLKALKDQDDVKAKQKDQDLDILKMMAGPRSGEFVQQIQQKQEDFDPWKTNGSPDNS